MDSQAIAEQLITQVRTHGLAVGGAHASMAAIKAGNADVLVIVKGYDPGQAWECTACGNADFETSRPGACPRCRGPRLREFEIRGELARIAEQRHVAVEVVEHSDALMRFGGIGCLLRYSGPANYLYSAA